MHLRFNPILARPPPRFNKILALKRNSLAVLAETARGKTTSEPRGPKWPCACYEN